MADDPNDPMEELSDSMATCWADMLNSIYLHGLGNLLSGLTTIDV